MASKAGLPHAAERRSPARAASAQALQLRAVPWSAMAEDVPAWDALALCAAEPNPFFESWYLLPALRAFDPDGKVCLLRFEAGGELAGLLPVASPRRYYGRPIPHKAAWLHDNCFLGAPLVAHGLEQDFWRCLLAWADCNAGLSLFLHLSHLPLTGSLHEALEHVLREQGRLAALVHREERALLRSAQPPSAYLEAALSGKKRKELRRQAARLAELGTVAVERRDGVGGLDAWIDEFLALEAAGWKGMAGSALACSSRTQALFRTSLQGAATRGRLERLALTLDGKPIAMLANFLTPPGAFSFKTAFDERLARYSPGVLLQQENLALLDRADVVWTDSCAAADHPMIDHLWRERRPIGRYSIAIGGTLRRAAFARLAALEAAR